MNIKKIIVFAFLSLAPIFSIEKIPADPVAAKLVDDFMKAINIQNETERLAAVLPLVHDSLKSNDKKDLFSNIKQFSYPRAIRMAKLYKSPVEIKEVHKGTSSTVGFKETAQKGRRDKYFIVKNPDVNGLPAPIHVFIPDDGSAPKIFDFGGL